MANVLLPIDPFKITQVFGVNYDTYKKFGLKGHNGWDIRTKYTDTPEGRRNIIAMQDVEYYKKGWDPNGYGNFFEVITRTSKNLWRHTFGHCHSINSFSHLPQGATMAISNNSGFSTAAHLHWTTKRINPDGSAKDYNNGYFGAVNPQEYLDEVRADSIIISPSPMPTLPGELYTYRRDWQPIAVRAGHDVNKHEKFNTGDRDIFEEYRQIDVLIADAKAQGEREAEARVRKELTEKYENDLLLARDQLKKCQDALGSGNSQNEKIGKMVVDLVKEIGKAQ